MGAQVRGWAGEGEGGREVWVGKVRRGLWAGMGPGMGKGEGRLNQWMKGDRGLGLTIAGWARE